MNLSEHIEQFRKQYPQIRPFEEEDDVEWFNQGFDLLKAGKLDQAERTFAKLALAQPDHSDGFEGLGLVYEEKGELLKAEMFLREAARKIERMVREGSMNAIFLNRIRSDVDRVLGKQLSPAIPPSPK
ncbi:MAG: tetratricopeptide repeat protein [Betaproteobacteria bacterium]|nr:MAG: tetratricopeptide repeat protein [Betaproteobacteria bacterium]